MDQRFSGVSDSLNTFEFDDGTQSLANGFKFKGTSLDHPEFDGGTQNLANGFKFEDTPLGHLKFEDETQNLANGFKFKGISLDLNFMDDPLFPPDPGPGDFVPSLSASVSPDGDSPDDSDFSDTVLKYISQMLMEENMEEKPCMFHDPLALQAAEKPFYEVLGEKYPPSPNQPPFYVESPDDNFSGSGSEYSSNGSNSTSNSVDPRWWIGDLVEYKCSFIKTPIPVDYTFQATLQSSSQSSFGSLNSFGNNVSGLEDPSISRQLVQSLFSDSESILQFNRGVEEARKFLPSGNNLIIDLEKYTLPLEPKDEAPEVVVKVEKDEREYSPNGSRGRKHHYREDIDLEEGRSNKQSAVYVEEAELSEMFDKVLLCSGWKQESHPCAVEKTLQNGASKCLQLNGEPHGSNGGKTRGKKQGSKKEVVDLRTLLVLCAQSVAADDRRTANELLKQIRQHSSPFGDGSQRLAHYFANGLEARVEGTGTQIYTALASIRTSAADMLKAYHLFILACPFKKISIFFANDMILHLAEKSTRLHIIDFGILYGFQWPILIQHLSNRPGGPPKLRITGIELPQPGFRPAERVEETGRRLAKYCERFKVPFEYNAIAQKWETIKIEDLKIDTDELLVVNSLLRFKNLLDETIVVNSPRNTVLNLIRKINPDLFVHSIVNGSYNAPFFVTRFREALFHFSAMFDMFDANIARGNQERLMLEKEFFGREAMNVIACEGSERVERPETYKQWQVRNMRAGFRPLPLDRELMKKLRAKVKAGYRKDFVFDEDGHWMLQGWKGRIVYASSCWIPAKES